MSKKLAIFLCLILTFWGIPQANKVVADDTNTPCEKIPVTTDISYTLGSNLTPYPLDPNASIPDKNLTAIFFKLTGTLPTAGNPTFRINFGGKDQKTTEDKASSDGAIYLSTNSPELTKIGSYIGTLEYSTDGGAHYGTWCKNIHYTISSTSYDGSKCQITFQVPPAINKLVVANVEKAPPGTFKIYYFPEKDSYLDTNKTNDQTVTIDKDSNNGFFTFNTNGTPRTDNPSGSRVGIALKTIVPTGQVGGDIPFCWTYFNIKAATQPVTTPECMLSLPPNKITTEDNVSVIATNLTAGQQYQASVIYKDISQAAIKFQTIATADKDGTTTLLLSQLNKPPAKFPEGNYSAQVFKYIDGTSNDPLACTADFHVGQYVGQPAPNATPCTGSDCTKGGGIPCGDATNPAIATAIGCIHTNPAAFAKDILKFVIGIAGGLAFLLMLLGAFQMITSAGNPETLNAGRDRLTSAVIGLLFIIFAVLLLQIIGLGILNIPGFK